MRGRRIIFRADASARIGSGHVMRCLTLADVLRARGAETIFACMTLLEPLRDRIVAAGHRLITLQERGEAATAELPLLQHTGWLPVSQREDAEQLIAAIEGSPCDCLVVDHYALDRRWEVSMRPHCGRLMVLDDLADRDHDCDALLDQNLGRDAADYAGRVPEGCQLLVGPSWALLRPEFARARRDKASQPEGNRVNRLLISLGGADPDGVVLRVLGALEGASLPVDCHITVVAGLTSPHLALVKSKLATLPWHGTVLEGVKDMAPLMAESDLAIGAAGGTAWERCAVGIPTILLVLADNQTMAARALATAGAALPVALPALEHELPRALAEIQQGAHLESAARAAAAVTDGEGALRVALAMGEALPPMVFARPAEPADEILLLDWANDPITRQSAFQAATISAEGHHAWFQARLTSPHAHRLFIIQRQPGVPVGQVRFDLTEDGTWEISYGLGPRYRGRGLGAPMLQAGIDAVHAALGPITLVARVKPENLASLRIFETLSFTPANDRNEKYATFYKSLR